MNKCENEHEILNTHNLWILDDEQFWQNRQIKL